MTLLTVWNETDPDTPVIETTDDAEILAEMTKLGARFSRWELQESADDAGLDEIMALYADDVERVKSEEGYTVVDIMGLVPGTDGYEDAKGPAREKFLSEHRHADDEDRFFAKGAGVFYLHANGRVHALYCEPGDWVSVPANTTHWFDMGTDPYFVSIRFFHEHEGWVGHFTGSPIAERFATFDQLHARRKELAAA